jgi:hypothetical protein
MKNNIHPLHRWQRALLSGRDREGMTGSCGRKARNGIPSGHPGRAEIQSKNPAVRAGFRGLDRVRRTGIEPVTLGLKPFYESLEVCGIESILIKYISNPARRMAA